MDQLPESSADASPAASDRAADDSAIVERSAGAEAVVWDSSVGGGRTANRADEALKRCPHCAGEYRASLRFCPLDGMVLRSPIVEGDLVGHVVADRYQVIAKLGAGGMGQVYLAEHVRLRRRCALKVLNDALLADEHAIARFDREATNLSRITHPHIAAVYDFGETADGGVYLAMEYVEGESLAALIGREHVLSPARTVSIVSQVADALTSAHELGMVHRDLKPDNVMVGRNRDGSDCIKVVDFGISKTLQAASQKITSTGLVIGTPAYMSPEQLVGDVTDHRSDVYSLGLITFELLTGMPPFPATADAVLARLAIPPRTLSAARPDGGWSPALEDVIRRVLAPAPDARFPTALEFSRALGDACGRHGASRGASDVATVSGPGRSLTRRRAAFALVGLASVVLLGVGGALLAKPLPVGTADATRRSAGGGGGVPVASVQTMAVTGAAAGPTRPTTIDHALPARERPRVAGASDATLPGKRGAPDTVSRSRGVVGPAANEHGAQPELDQMRTWTDPESGSEETAREALAMLPRVLPRLTTGTDSVSAEYYAVEAHLLLGDQAAACRRLQAIAGRASRHPFLANAVREYLADSTLHCR